MTETLKKQASGSKTSLIDFSSNNKSYSYHVKYYFRRVPAAFSTEINNMLSDAYTMHGIILDDR
jgi:hypothetical protein